MKIKLNILIILLIVFVLFSCKKKDSERNSREYITESGFSIETSLEETKTVATKLYDIKKHPEDWSMTNRETYKYILMALFDKTSREDTYSYRNDYEILPLSEHFRKKFDLSKHGLGLFTIEYEVVDGDDGIVDHVDSFNATDEEFKNNEVWCHRSNYVYDSQLKLKYYLDKNNCLDNIEVVEPEVITNNIRENEIDYDNNEYSETFSPDEIKIEGIKMLVESDMDEFEIWKNYDWTHNFLSKFNTMLGLINGLDQYAVSKVESNELTDIDKKRVGLTITMDDGTVYKYQIYFNTDIDDKIDSITKVEEVLEDGTVVEVENNFGK